MAKKSEKAEKQNDIKIDNPEEVRDQELQDNAAAEAEGEEKKEPKAEGADETAAEADEAAASEDAGEVEVEVKKEPTTEEQLAAMQDKYLRLTAEYDNYRKRTLNEKIELQKSANQRLLEAILPVADDFDRALQSLEEAKDLKAVKEGMNLIFGKFQGFLTQQGVKEIEAKEKAFDTDLHEAITKVPAPSKKLKGKVVDVVQKGYYLNDKVLRFSKVVIGE